MNDRVFDAITRRTARALDRRSLLGLLAGAVLADFPPLAAMAKDNGSGHGGHGDGGGHGGGGRGGGGKKKKECPGAAVTCRGYYAYWCGLYYPFDGRCFSNFNICCDLYGKCKNDSAANCEGWYGNIYF